MQNSFDSTSLRDLVQPSDDWARVLLSLPKYIGVCKRRNNSKRDFVFVNSRQGKYTPTDPYQVVALVEELTAKVVDSIRAEAERRGVCIDDLQVALIGFAETATGIAHLMWDALDRTGVKCCFFGCTTRKAGVPDGADFVIDFEESHSHAVDQRFYGLSSVKPDVVVILDDELTTGNTVEKLVNGLAEFWCTKKWILASFLNWMPENAKKTKKEQICCEVSRKEKDCALTCDLEFVSLHTGSIGSHYDLKGPFEEARDLTKMECGSRVKSCVEELTLSRNAWKACSRLNPTKEECDDCVEELQNRVAPLIDSLSPGSRVLILGTEEFMGIPMALAKKLADRRYERLGLTEDDVKSLTQQGHLSGVFFQASTRGPVWLSKYSGYLLRNGVMLDSPYDHYETYLYNLQLYDLILGFCDNQDGMANEFAKRIAQEFYRRGMDYSQVRMFLLGGERNEK